MATQVTIQGFDELRQNLKKFQDRFDQEMEKGVLKGAEVVVADAKRRVTVVSGKLKGSLAAKIYRKSNGYVNADAGYLNTEGFGNASKGRYFIYYELGTSRQKARAPLRKAVRAVRNQVKVEIQKPLEAILR